MVLLVIGVGSDELVGAGRRTFGEVLALPHTTKRIDRRTNLVICRSDEPFACAIPGRDAAVVITTGLRAILTRAQLASVVAHERAHLRGRYYAAMRLAVLNRASLPAWRPGRRLPRATNLLVELITDDDEAARRPGAVHLANALIRIRHTHDPSMDLRAERLADRQWAWARELAPSPAVITG